MLKEVVLAKLRRKSEAKFSARFISNASSAASASLQLVKQSAIPSNSRGNLLKIDVKVKVARARTEAVEKTCKDSNEANSGFNNRRRAVFQNEVIGVNVCEVNLHPVLHCKCF